MFSYSLDNTTTLPHLSWEDDTSIIQPFLYFPNMSYERGRTTPIYLCKILQEYLLFAKGEVVLHLTPLPSGMAQYVLRTNTLFHSNLLQRYESFFLWDGAQLKEQDICTKLRPVDYIFKIYRTLRYDFALVCIYSISISIIKEFHSIKWWHTIFFFDKNKNYSASNMTLQLG